MEEEEEEEEEEGVGVGTSPMISMGMLSTGMAVEDSGMCRVAVASVDDTAVGEDRGKFKTKEGACWEVDVAAAGGAVMRRGACCSTCCCCCTCCCCPDKSVKNCCCGMADRMGVCCPVAGSYTRF